MSVAIIPARGGSKRIPRKNIKLFRGKPLISYSIEAALSSGLFQRVIVTTDDQEVAEVAREHGAETPFVRPAELADDHAGTAAVVCHALQWLKSNGELPEFNCCLYATAPFVTSADLKGALSQLEGSTAEYCFSVTSFPFPVQRALVTNDENRLSMLQPEHRMTRSQDLPETLHDAGQFYWSRGDAWIRDVAVFSEASIPWVLPRHRVQDIDTPEDWLRAECLHEVLERMGELR